MAAAILIAAVAAQAAPATLADALGQATRFCEIASDSPTRDIPPGVELFLPDAAMPGLPQPAMDAMRKSQPALAAKVAPMQDVARPFSALPPLIQRVMATSISRHLAEPSAALRFSSASGEVWAMAYRGSTCEVAVTGSNTPVDNIIRSWADSLKPSWTLVRSVESSASSPLSERLMLKTAPLPDAPAHGTRMRLRWLAPAAAQPDGVQAEINYLSGDIAQPAPAGKP